MLASLYEMELDVDLPQEQCVPHYFAKYIIEIIC